jgi:hypothetical protein
MISETRIVAKVLKNYPETISGKHPIDSLQNIAVQGTSHILRRVLQSETSSLSGEVHHWLKTRSTRGKETCGKRRDQ